MLPWFMAATAISTCQFQGCNDDQIEIVPCYKRLESVVSVCVKLGTWFGPLSRSAIAHVRLLAYHIAQGQDLDFRSQQISSRLCHGPRCR